MKTRTRLECLLVLIIVFSWCPAHADVINVISQQYSIRGDAHYYFNDPNYPEYGSPFTVSYQQTSNLPVSQHTTWPPGLYAGYAYAESSAGGGVTANNAWVDSSAYLNDAGSAISDAYASASITFSPLVTTMLVSADITQGAEITLVDVTGAPVTLYSYSGFNSSESSLMSFDLSHIYSISTIIDVSGTPWIPFHGSLSIESVPEPATLLFLVLGLVGVVGAKRKFKN